MSEFKEEKKVMKDNYLLFKQGQKERLLLISEVEIDVMFSWYESFKDFTLRAKDHSKAAVERLENGPLGKKICMLVVLVPELEMYDKWYKSVKSPSEEDKRVYEIINGALNPTPPSPEEKG